MMMPVLDGDSNGDDEIDKEDGKDEEMHGWIEAAVILETLGCGHRWSLSLRRREQHSILGRGKCWVR